MFDQNKYIHKDDAEIDHSVKIKKSSSILLFERRRLLTGAERRCYSGKND